MDTLVSDRSRPDASNAGPSSSIRFCADGSPARVKSVTLKPSSFATADAGVSPSP